jgi:hypothetical protein
MFGVPSWSGRHRKILDRESLGDIGSTGEFLGDGGVEETTDQLALELDHQLTRPPAPALLLSELRLEESDRSPPPETLTNRGSLRKSTNHGGTDAEPR